MRDFDQERGERSSRDRTFKLGGHEFRFRAGIEPELYAEYADLFSQPVAEEARIVAAAMERAGLLPVDGAEPTTDQRPIDAAWNKIASIYSSAAAKAEPVTQASTVALLDRVVTEYLVPADRDAWRELRADTTVDAPITELDMVDLINHMTEVTTRRPTSPASDSGPGDETPGTTSTPALQPVAVPS